MDGADQVMIQILSYCFAEVRGVNNLIHANSEDLELNSQSHDLIVIIGSLEHCRDPNKVLEICYKSLKVGGIIVNEGRYYPVSYSYRWLNANHQRFLEHSSSIGMMLKHGFDLIESTIYPVCGISTEETEEVILQKINQNMNKEIVIL